MANCTRCGTTIPAGLLCPPCNWQHVQAISKPLIVELKARTGVIERLVEECAAGKIPFSGAGSLSERVAAMGYNTTALYEMVRAAEARLALEPKP